MHNASAPAWCLSDPPGTTYPPTLRTTLHLRRNLTQGQIDNVPNLTATALPIVRVAKEVLRVQTGQGVGGGIRNLFIEEQYWIMGNDFQAALNAGRQPAIAPSTYVVGHIIGMQFGGSGGWVHHPDEVVANVYPQNPSTSSKGAYDMVETAMRMAIDCGNKVCVRITLNYPGNANLHLPTSVTIRWWEITPAGVETAHAPPNIPN